MLVESGPASLQISFSLIDDARIAIRRRLCIIDVVAGDVGPPARIGSGFVGLWRGSKELRHLKSK
jgi:hypothetical protein